MIPRFVIADTTPVSLLSLLGREGLDLLCATEAELVITDVVKDELLEEPGPGADAARERRSAIAAWLAAHEAQGRMREMSTSAGRLYRTAMAGWRAMGSPAGNWPSRRDLGEASIVGLLSELTRQAGPDRTIFVIMDDRAGRAAVRALDVANIALTGTAAFLRVLEVRYGIALAATAWVSIAVVLRVRVGPGTEDDLVLMRF